MSVRSSVQRFRSRALTGDRLWSEGPVERGRPAMSRLAASIVVVLLVATVAPAAVTAAPAAPVAPASPVAQAGTAAVLEGIDVSHWQGTITWSKVAAAGKKFTIIKASEDDDFVDDHYLTNRSGAQAAGLWTGSYHFARPSAVANDAINEADHFVSTARFGVGDLIPALDLEDAGGLGTAALTTWVRTWLDRVTARIGIRPMIYVSPAFWTKYLANTTSLADAGYRTLWIAHWGVTSPTVPASNWGGNGWTFWQYSNAGSVSGITGRVDLDRFNGTDLARSAYSIFNLSAKAGSQVKQGQTGAAATVGIARTNFTDLVTLDVAGLPAGATADFVDSPTTSTAATLNITTDAGSTPTGTFPLTITGSGNGLTRTTKVSLVVADGIPPVVVAPSLWLEPGTTVGTSTVPVYVKWSASDPSGIASYAVQRSINGGAWTTVTPSPPTLTSGYQSLPFGVGVREQVRAADKKLNTSAWAVSPTIGVLLSQQTGGAISWHGTWTTQSTSVASGGTMRYGRFAGASATYTFTGSSIGWVAARGPDRGSAKVYVDGVYAKTVSLYSSSRSYRYVAFARNFGVIGSHTIRIVVEGTHGHPRVDVDAFARLAIN
jgi:GH25 family lysozyme M1 (1,4-beta-N-acetylmuramidase)